MCSCLNTDFYFLKVIFSAGCRNFLFFFLSVLSQQITGAEFTCCLLCGITKAGRKTPNMSIDFSFLRLKKKKNSLFSFFPPSHASLKGESLAEDEMACFEVCLPAAPPPRCLALIVGALQGCRWGKWHSLFVENASSVCCVGV